jgi:predicted amidohydrolase YtcJ
MQSADLIVVAEQIHSIASPRRTYRAIAIGHEPIVASSEEPDRLDGLRDARTRDVGGGSLVA